MSQPSADVTFNVVAQKASAQMDAFTSMMKRKLKELRDETAKVNRAGGAAGGAGTGGTTFAGWAADIGKARVAMLAMGAPTQALRTMAQLVKQEFQQIVELAEAARTKQVPYQALLSTIAKSLPAGEDAAVVMPQIDRMIQEAKVGDKAGLTRAMIEAGSVGAGVSYLAKARSTIALAEANQDLLMTNPVAFQQLAGAVVLGNQLFGAEGATVDSQQALFYRGLTSSRVNDPKLYAENILSGGAAGLRSAFGLSQIDSLALLNSMTNVMQDATGDLAPTAAFSLMNAMQKGEQRFGFKLPEGLRDKLDFLQGDDPRAVEFRKFALGAYLEGFDLTDDERLMLSDANLNKELAMNLPGSRMKNIHAVTGLLQPKGTHEQVGGAKEQLQVGYDELGAPRGANPQAVHAELGRQFRQTQAELKRLGLTDAMDREVVASAGVGSALTGDRAKAVLAHYFNEGDGGHAAFMRSVGGSPAFRKRMLDQVNLMTSGLSEQAWLENLRQDYDYAFAMQVPKRMQGENLRKWVPGGLSASEAQEWGVSDQQRGRINSILDSLKLVAEQLGRLNDRLETESKGPKEVRVVNQAPSQPRKPAAEGLRQ